MSNPCSCPLAGYCERHRVEKGKHWHYLCQTRSDYRDKWDVGKGPGQNNPELQVAIQVARQTRVERGRKLWAELHTKQDATPEWFALWMQRVPSFGCGCRNAFAAIIAVNPPQYDDWFAWTVEAHNAVNDKLNKPQITIEEARTIWQME